MGRSARRRILIGAFLLGAVACSQRYGAEEGTPGIDRVDGAADGASPTADAGGTPDGPSASDGATADAEPTFGCAPTASRICLDFEDNTLGSAQGFGVKATGAQIVSSARARTGKVGASATAISLQGGRAILARALPMAPKVVRMTVHVYLESPAASFDLFAVQADDADGPLAYMAAVRDNQLVLYNGRAVEGGAPLTLVPTNRWLRLDLVVDFASGTVRLEQDKTLVQVGSTKAAPTQVSLVIGPTIIDSAMGTYGYDDIQIDLQ